MDLTTSVNEFRDRFRENRKKKKINNSDLYAGSPMYFYCLGCKANHAILPEDYTTPASKYCDDCQKLIDDGFDIHELRQEALAD